jgi:hypothetical protein
MTTQIDRFSLVTAPLSLYFNEQHLSHATGFIWKDGRQHYLITHWHVVSGRNANDGQLLSAHGGRQMLSVPGSTRASKCLRNRNT